VAVSQPFGGLLPGRWHYWYGMPNGRYWRNLAALGWPNWHQADRAAGGT
jgi:hypothetical protein